MANIRTNPHKKATDNNSLSFMQLNLQHSKTATDNLNLFMKEAHVDIALIQEPYVYQNQVKGISRKNRIFSSGQGKKRAAIVVNNTGTDVILIHQMSEEDIVVVEITHGNRIFIAVSAYLDIGKDIKEDLNKIKKIIQLAKGKGLLVAIDSNARSKTWHDVITNKRGRQLEEFVIENRLHIINEDSQVTTFESSRGNSNVDLTITDNNMLTLVKEWRCDEQESFSDHRIITFRVEKHRDATRKYTHHGIRFITNEEGYKKFEKNFITEIRQNFEIAGAESLDEDLSRAITTNKDIELLTEKYQDSMAAACRKSFQVRKGGEKTTMYKSVPWWTTELTIMRKKINAMRRRYQRTIRDEKLREDRKKIYLLEKKKYAAALRKSKITSWKQYCNATTTTNPWNAVYKLASGNFKQNNTLSTLRKPDGTYTKDLTETMRYMIETFTPEDKEETDNAGHKLIRAAMKVPITTEDDIPFTTKEIKEAIKGMDKTKAPGEDGITSDILKCAFSLLPLSTTALYNGCLRAACFPKRWKRAIIIPIIKPGKENSNDIAKYRPISLISTLAKVLERVLMGRIMHYLHSHNLLSQNQYGFTPQTSTIDAVMDLKHYIQRSMDEGQYAALISLDVQGAFDAAWWPRILYSLKKLKCPKNLYNLCGNYFSGRSAALILKSRKEQRTVSKGCPQGSASGPGFWNIQFNSILQIEFKKDTKIIAYADDLLILTKGKTQEEVENYANIELSKITRWARENKMKFNEQKSKMMILTRRRPKIKREFKIYLNNTKMRQEETIKYLGIILDKRLNFNAHIDYTTGKCIKLIHALSKSAKVNWGLRHDVIRMIYFGAILPILSYGVQVWVESLQRKCNTAKIRRIQRLTNIKMAKAYRTTSYEALCVLTGITPITITLKNMAKLYYITRKNQDDLYDAPLSYRRWPHPAKAIELHNKQDDMQYKLEIYTDGSKTEKRVGSGVAIFADGSLTHQLRYKLAERCSNNQAEQLAIAKALEKIQEFSHFQGNQRSVAIHTDSKITLDAIANPRNHQNLVEQIRDEIRRLENDNWTIHFTWVKAHNDNYVNELADQVAKEAASRSEAETAYNKIPKSAVIRE